MKLNYEVETDDLPLSQKEMMQWSINHGIKILQMVEKHHVLEIAKIQVAVDAIERGCEDEIPKSIQNFIKSKEQEINVELPLISYK